MSTINERRAEGLLAAKRMVSTAESDLDYANRLVRDLEHFEHLSPEIVYVGDTFNQWCVNIPPTHPDHFDGDNILAPYGGVYFETLSEAAAFMDRVLNEIEGGN